MVDFMNDLTERHDGFEASGNTPKKFSSCLAIELSGLTSDANGEFFCSHLLKMLQKHIEVVAAVWLISLDEHPLLKDGFSLLLRVWVKQVFLEKPVRNVVLARFEAVLVKPFCLLKQLVVHFVGEHRPLAIVRVVTRKRISEAEWNNEVALFNLV